MTITGVFRGVQIFAWAFSVSAGCCLTAAKIAGEVKYARMSDWMETHALVRSDAEFAEMGDYVALYGFNSDVIVTRNRASALDLSGFNHSSR